MSSTNLDFDAPHWETPHWETQHRETPHWRKSIRSMNHGACVEVALVAGGMAVRDSVDAEGCVISYPRAVWLTFISNLKSLIGWLLLAGVVIVACVVAPERPDATVPAGVLAAFGLDANSRHRLLAAGAASRVSAGHRGGGRAPVAPGPAGGARPARRAGGRVGQPVTDLMLARLAR